jgi:hypothetical protein
MFPLLFSKVGDKYVKVHNKTLAYSHTDPCRYNVHHIHNTKRPAWESNPDNDGRGL